MKSINFALAIAAVLFTIGCIGDIDSHYGTTTPVSIGGAITGLAPGEQVVLELYEGGSKGMPLDSKIYTSDGNFTFDAKISGTRMGSAYTFPWYEVVVKEHPEGKYCVIDRRQEQIALEPINHVQVICGDAQLPDLHTSFPDLALAYCVNQQAFEGGYTTLEEFTMLYCRWKGVTDPTGIELLPSLQKLYLRGNNLNSLDLSQNVELISVSVSDNGMTSLTVASPKLYGIDAQHNALTSMDFSNCPLTEVIHINHNNLTNLNLSGLTELRWLNAGNNNISELDTSDLLNIYKFLLNDNLITTIDLSQAINVIDDVYLHRNPLDDATIEHLEYLEATGAIDFLLF